MPGGSLAVPALVSSAIINGLLAPVVLFVLLAVMVDAKLMEGQASPRIAVAIIALTALLMTGAGVAMFL